MLTSRNSALTILVVLSFLQGCTSGKVHDAQTGVPIDSVVVELVVGDCTGSGCKGASATALTDGFGFFGFDPYDVASPQLITSSVGQEAVELRVSKSGYESVTIFHRLNYQQFTFDGKKYLVSFIRKVYLCIDPSLDSDGDSICDTAELRYGTNPNNPDSDGDSLSDAAEIYGYDGVDLEYFGANPLRKDVLVEIDYYSGLWPEPEAIKIVVEAFAAAPVTNQDGSTGINLALDISDEIENTDADPDLNPVFAEFDIIKNKYFPARRASIFHYGLFANQISSGMYSGMSRGLPASDFIVSLGSAWYVPGGWMMARAGTLMHEMGHNLGLHHGGFNDAWNLKPNYLSIMNYYYQVFGLTVDGRDGILDYSRLHIDVVDETNLNERLAFAPVSGSGTSEADLARYSVMVVGGGILSGNASELLDFNRNETIEESTAIDLDGDSRVSSVIPASNNDWDQLVFHGGGVIGDAHLVEMSQVNLSAFTPPEQIEPCMPRLDYSLR
jgi:hypothetical protein